jgi:hypothetical protein
VLIVQTEYKRTSLDDDVFQNAYEKTYMYQDISFVIV